jgi:GNAT superfamily N-acetyltransferase
MISLRPINLDDLPLLKDLIYEFAEFERERDLVEITEDDLRRDGFGAEPRFRSLMAECDGEVAGYAIFFPVFCTWEGRAALFLEDLYVRPQFRGKGIGKAVLEHLAGIAKQEGCFGMKWEVLDWNQPALDFYHSIGAELQADRRVLLFKGEAFERMAGARERKRA